MLLRQLNPRSLLQAVCDRLLGKCHWHLHALGFGVDKPLANTLMLKVFIQKNDCSKLPVPIGS